jgi:hypothetical protein
MVQKMGIAYSRKKGSLKRWILIGLIVILCICVQVQAEVLLEKTIKWSAVKGNSPEDMFKKAPPITETVNIPAGKGYFVEIVSQAPYSGGFGEQDVVEFYPDKSEWTTGILESPTREVQGTMKNGENYAVKSTGKAREWVGGVYQVRKNWETKGGTLQIRFNTPYKCEGFSSCGNPWIVEQTVYYKLEYFSEASGTASSGSSTTQTGTSSGTSGSGTTSGIVGTWKWFNGDTVYVHPDGTQDSLNAGKTISVRTWTLKDPSKGIYELVWKNPNGIESQWYSGIDTLTLSADGNKLDGYNQKNMRVTASRISSSDSSSTSSTTSVTNSACSGTGPSLYVEDRAMNTGQQVTIPIMMCNAQDIANMDLSVGYSNSALQFMRATKGALNPNVLFDSNNVGSKVKISFAGNSGFSGTGSIAILTFQVIGQSGASSPVTVTVDSAGTTGGKSVTIPVKSGKVTVGNTNPDNPGGRAAGKATALDALIALKISVEKMPFDANYDVAKDGKVNSNDARQILVLAAGY